MVRSPAKHVSQFGGGPSSELILITGSDPLSTVTSAILRQIAQSVHISNKYSVGCKDRVC